MARTPKTKPVEKKTEWANDKEIPVRLEIVKTLVVIPNFMELDLDIQLNIIETMVKYVLTGEK
jgi:hypothetical protein